jgi:hypothetical protein
VRRRRRLIAGAFGAAAILLAACGGDRAGDRAATERMFLETCAPGDQPAQVAVCRCAFERLTEDLSDEELEDLDQRVRGEPEELPDEVVEAALECASEPLTPPTAKPEDDTTTTTEREP